MPPTSAIPSPNTSRYVPLAIGSRGSIRSVLASSPQQVTAAGSLSPFAETSDTVVESRVAGSLGLLNVASTGLSAENTARFRRAGIRTRKDRGIGRRWLSREREPFPRAIPLRAAEGPRYRPAEAKRIREDDPIARTETPNRA